MIYFAQPVAGGVIKIGFSNTPWARLRQLQTGSPVDLQLLSIAEGHAGHEAELHLWLEDDRDRLEWYRPTRRVKALVKVTRKDPTILVRCMRGVPKVDPGPGKRILSPWWKTPTFGVRA